MVGAKGRRRHMWVLLAVILLLFATYPVDSLPAMANQEQFSGDLVVPVLNYHLINDLYHPLSIAPQEFDQQMAYLYEEGYQTITPDQLLNHLEMGAALPEKPIVITFDDGYLDNYTNAFPTLRKYGFTATVFVIADAIGKDPRFMNWDQAREMSSSGFDIESHTLTHVDVTKTDPENLWQEVAKSKKVIEQQLNKPVKYMAYPKGTYNQTAEDLLIKAGYKGAFTIRFGEVSSQSDHFALERIPIFRTQKTFRSFILRLHGAPLLERLGIIKQ